MTNVLILGGNGTVARLVTQNLTTLSDDFHITLYLRDAQRVAALLSGQVTSFEGDVLSTSDLAHAMQGQDIIFVSMGATRDLALMETIIAAMHQANVTRIISINDLGIYDELPGKLGEWNKRMVGNGLKIGRASADVLTNSDLDETTIRLAWLTNDDNIDYQVFHRNDAVLGSSVSRKSVADIVTKIIIDPTTASHESIGIAQASTAGQLPF